MRFPLEASKCYEEAGQFKQAIKLLVDHNLFQGAIDCLHRYQILVKVMIYIYTILIPCMDTFAKSFIFSLHIILNTQYSYNITRFA